MTQAATHDVLPPASVGPSKSSLDAHGVPASRKRRPGRLLRAGGLLLARVAFAGVLVALRQQVVTLELVDRTVSSSPSAVADRLVDLLGSEILWTNLWATLSAALIAFVLASVVGVVIGITLALLPTVERIVSPFLEAVNAMPRIALAPVFVVAFGLSITSKIALAFSLVVFMLISAARAGVRSVDVDIQRLAQTLGATRRQMFAKVLLPVAVPAIFGGLRLGIIYSLLGVVTAELIASTNGVGQLLQQYAGLFATDSIYALLIVLAVTAGVISALMSRLESRLLTWQPDR